MRDMERARERKRDYTVPASLRLIRHPCCPPSIINRQDCKFLQLPNAKSSSFRIFTVLDIIISALEQSCLSAPLTLCLRHGS